MTTTRSAAAMVDRRCAMTILVIGIPLTVRDTTDWVMLSSALVASSMNISLGSDASARAIWRRCR